MKTSKSAGHAIGAVILAAGRSARMGRPKLLLPWGGTSMLGHQIQVWQQLGVCQITVVCAVGDGGIGAELDRLSFPADARIFNLEPERGMFSSIRCAAHWSGWRANLARLAIVLGDQPQIRPETLRALVEFSAGRTDQVCQPRVFGRLRHPVILPRSVFAPLCDSSASSLKQFLRSRLVEVAACDTADPGLAFDLDTPSDYQRALELCFPVT